MELKEVLDKVGFPVTTDELQTVKHKVPVTDSVAIVRLDIDPQQCLGIVSRRYKLVTHREALAKTLAFLEENDFNFTEVYQRNHGQVIMVEALGKKEAKVEDETIVPRVLVTNSYNRTKAVDFSYGAYDKTRKHGLTIPSYILKHVKVGLRKKHIGKVHEDIEKVQADVYLYSELFKDVTSFYKKMVDVKLSEADTTKALKEVFRSDETVSEIIAMRQKDTAWATYLALVDYQGQKNCKENNQIYRSFREIAQQQRFLNLLMV